MTYEDFTTKCMASLKTLQAELHQHYNIDSYKKWWYDQHTGLFTFSEGQSQELNFRYVAIGTFSEKSNTWMWAWHKQSTLAKARKASEIIKEFGETHRFEKLTTGSFESDEFNAWEFAAIALELLGGIGAYRPVSDNLKKFVILQEFVPADEARAIKDKYVACDAHEKGRLSFVRQHLTTKTKVGFNEAFETVEWMELEEDDDFQAWCDACEKAWETEDGWNETSMAFANSKIVCENCYFDMKEFNLGSR